MPAIDIETFVRSIVGLSQTLQSCGDVAVDKAHDQYLAGTITYSEYSGALQQKIAIVESCYSMTNAASGVLLDVAQNKMGPILDATARLTQAAGSIDKIQSAVLVVSEVVGAAAAVATAIGAPSATSITAGGAALVTLSQQILKDAGAL
jgi:hypothetical protein